MLSGLVVVAALRRSWAGKPAKLCWVVARRQPATNARLALTYIWATPRGSSAPISLNHSKQDKKLHQGLSALELVEPVDTQPLGSVVNAREPDGEDAFSGFVTIFEAAVHQLDKSSGY